MMDSPSASTSAENPEMPQQGPSQPQQQSTMALQPSTSRVVVAQRATSRPAGALERTNVPTQGNARAIRSRRRLRARLPGMGQNRQIAEFHRITRKFNKLRKERIAIKRRILSGIERDARRRNGLRELIKVMLDRINKN